MVSNFEMTRDDYAESCYNKQNSNASKRSAYTALDSYDKFLKEKFNKTDDEMFVELQEIENTPKFYQFLNLYVQYLLKNNSSPGTVGTYLMHVKGYLRGRGLRIYNEDVKQYVKRPKQVRRMKKPLTRDHIRKLIKVSSRRMIAFYLLCASSGLRKDEAWFLKVSDIDDTVFPVRIRVRAENTKGREERYSFITPEAYDAVKPFMENKSDNDFIFAKVRNTGLENSVDTMFQRCRKKAGLLEKQSDELHYVVHIHAFRSYAFTEVTKRFGSDFGHKLIGHHEYLDTYDQRTVDEMAEKYKELIPDLTMDDSNRLSNKLEDTQRRLEELDETKRRLFDVETKLSRMADKD